MVPLKPEALQKMYHFETGVLSTQCCMKSKQRGHPCSKGFLSKYITADNSHIQIEKGKL